MYIEFDGDWTILKDMGKMDYVELNELGSGNYYEKMARAHKLVMQALKDAQAKGADYVMFNYGCPTPGSFFMTPKSMVMSIVKSKEAAPYINKKSSIRHSTVFVAAIKPKRT